MASAIFIFLVQFFLNNGKTTFQSKAVGGSTKTVCETAQAGCQFAGGEGIQQAVDAASNGDTILIKNGRYTRNTFTPVNENYSHGQCFVNTHEKSLTLKGEGNPVIDGQNDEFGTGIKDLFRAGICVMGGAVTIDSIWVKQTLAPSIVTRDSQLIVKNFFAIDIDNSFMIIHPNVNALIVNSFFSGNGPIRVDSNSNLTLVNNTLYGKGLDFNVCKTPYPTGIVTNNILSHLEDTGISLSCPENKAQFNGLTASYNLIWRSKVNEPSNPQAPQDCLGNEICNTRNEIRSDPLFENPAIYGDVGWAAWTDFHLKDGSPAKGISDSSVPGDKQLGMYGGPCTNPDSASCTQYINAHLPNGSPNVSPTVGGGNNISPTQSPVVPTLGQNDARLNMKAKFQGATNASSGNTISAKITLQGQGSGVTKSINFSPDTNGVWSASAIFPNIATTSNYQVFIKGARHLQRKICDPTPSETNPGEYKCTTAKISLTYGDNNLDFSGIYLFAGDVNQDGVVDSSDTSSVRSNLGKTDAQSLAVCDVNFDGVCDSQDFSLVIAALRIRFDDEK